MNLEHELRQALKRKDPGIGFDQSVIRKVRSGAADAGPSRPTRWKRLALPLAASLVLTATGSYYAVQHQHQRQQRQIRAEQAAYDLVLALAIASEKVSAVQVKVQEITHHDGQVPY